MKKTLNLNIVTPDGIIYEKESPLVICKTTVGELGIMPNHIPLLASLAIDSVRVKNDEGNFEEIAVSGGFLEFSNNTLSIVASSAERSQDIDKDRALLAKQRAEKRIIEAKKSNNNDELQRAEISLRRAVNRLSVSKK